MSAREYSDDLITLVRDPGNGANFGDGCPSAMLEAAESQLGVTLPPSYRQLVAEFGTWDIAGLEFLGVYTTPAMGDELLGTVRETLDARESLGLPVAMLVVMLDDLGLVVLDSSRPDESGEYPVLSWNPGNETEVLGNSFGQYALEQCESAIQRQWRG